MPPKLVKSEPHYYMEIQLTGHHTSILLGSEPGDADRFLEVDAYVFAERDEHDAAAPVTALPSSDDDAKNIKQIRAYLEESMGVDTALVFAGKLQAFTFPIAEGMVDDCDADSQAAYDIASTLGSDSGELHPHVKKLLGGPWVADKLRTVVNVWDSTLPVHHYAALPLALRVLHSKFGSGIVSFSGGDAEGAYLERFGFQRVRRPVEDIKAAAKRAARSDMKRKAFPPSELPRYVQQYTDSMVEEDESVAVWVTAEIAASV